MLLALLLALSVSVNAFDKPASGETVLTLTVPEPDTAPPAVTITVGQSRWESFLSTISFGLLFHDTQRVSIAAQDESGVDTLAYLTRTSALTAKAVQDDALVWTEIENGGYFTVSPYEKQIVYVRAADKKGNVGYYCSDGFIVQKCYLDGDRLVVVMDNSQLPAGVNAYIAAYDRGRMLTVTTGSATQDGWQFDSKITQRGDVWRCFFTDASNKPVRGAVELRELADLR